MCLRRLGLAVPLAFLVAILAHLAGFGADHAPGAAHAHGLLLGLAATLGLLALATIFAGALRLERRDKGTSPQAPWLPIVLAAGGFAAFGAIELVEGHAPFGGGLRALAAIGPAAVLVAKISRIAARMLRRTGAALAALAPPHSLPLPRFAATRLLRMAASRSADARGSARGRAPPIPV